MLYIYYGTDIKKILNQSQKMIEALKQKREFAQVFYFYADSFDKDLFDNIEYSQGLFFDKHIFVLKNFIEAKKDIRDCVLKNIRKFIDSTHLYILLENEIEDKYLKEIQLLKDINIKEFNLKSNIKTSITKEQIDKQKFDLAASIMNLKSKKIKSNVDIVKVLIQIDDIKKYFDVPEEFFGILWWRYKKFASKDKDNMKNLLNIYHNAHGGEEDMWIGLERWVSLR